MMAHAIGLAALAAAAAAPMPARPVYREIKDFVVACDNLRTCVVRWAPEDGDDGFGAYLAITREGGATGAIRVELAAPEENRRPLVRTLMLDGRPLGRDLPWRGEESPALEGEQALAFVRAARNGEVLTFSDGVETRSVTLRGLTAALLAIDEAQGRLGTVGAYVRTGAAPNATVPAPPPLPVIVARRADAALTAPAGFAAQVRRANARALSDCDEARQDADAAYPLTRGEVLVALGCMMHAYQSSMLLLRAPRDAPERAQLVVMPMAAGDQPPGPDDRGRFVEGEWDPKTASFFEAAKGRGLGDCGLSTSWVFDGAAFRLAEAHRMNRCAGGPPGDWPTVYRSKVVVR
jgi:hypothetical protein